MRSRWLLGARRFSSDKIKKETRVAARDHNCKYAGPRQADDPPVSPVPDRGSWEPFIDTVLICVGSQPSNHMDLEIRPHGT
ncbi:hypothetical protein NDU88_000751 [Pleurodeles waltl]|uniref:Uncharacterized protein n=1 Tax=Pleurodeles waltl TaxID=8319 RepID=A0AAV7LVS7_PLEWA|nr:hypothetical protein NDU88_000751 [Pleurodeles waltl]